MKQANKQTWNDYECTDTAIQLAYVWEELQMKNEQDEEDGDEKVEENAKIYIVYIEKNMKEF